MNTRNYLIILQLNADFQLGLALKPSQELQRSWSHDAHKTLDGQLPLGQWSWPVIAGALHATQPDHPNTALAMKLAIRYIHEILNPTPSYHP